MEFRLNSGKFLYETSVSPDGRNQNKQEASQSKIIKTAPKQRYFEAFDTSSRDIMANYGKAGIIMNHRGQNLPNGLSEYKYKDSKYKIYRHGDRYRSEFIGRHGVDRNEFFKHFEELQPQKRGFKDYASSAIINDINGRIDTPVLQGNTGDCWLLTALEAMSSTQAGKEIIANSIYINNDNTVTINFSGLGVSYTLTAEEIAKHDTDNTLSDSYSNGDNDALIMELAVEKLWKDINSGRVSLNTNNEDITYTDRSIDGGGLPIQMIYYLTGVEANEYYNDDLSNLSKNTIYQVLQNALENGSTAVNFGIYYNEHSAKLIDGSTYSLDVEDGGHALAITNITSDTVTFVNPWDSSEEYTMSWSEFASLGIGYMSSADLTKAKDTREFVDMIDDSNSIDNNDNHDWNNFPDDNNWYIPDDSSSDFDPFEPQPSHDDDDFKPSPIEPFEPDFVDDEIYEIDDTYDITYDYGNNNRFYNFSFDDFLMAFWEFFISFFARYN